MAVPLTCFSVGCSDTSADFSEDLVTVTGTVTMDGTPVENATVTFLAKEGPSRSTAAITNAEGVYSMETSAAGFGVLPGPYEVVVSKFMQPDGSPVPPETPPMDVGAVEQLPKKYSSFALPTLSANVDPEGGLIDFELKSKK